MHDETIQLRQPAGDLDSLRAFSAPISAAFGDDYTEAMLEVDRQLWDLDRLIGAVDGETWVGGATVSPMRLTVPGGAEVRAAAVTGAGVAPTHRRRGILTRLMRWIVDEAADRGEPLVVLHASEGAIYPHFGFGLATLQGTIEFDRWQVRLDGPADPLGRVRFVSVDEGMGIIPALYDRIRIERPGEVSRGPSTWRLQLLADSPWRRSSLGPKFNVVLETGGEARGYALYRIKEEWDERGPKHVLTVLEVAGLDPASERALWQWLMGIDLVGRIRGWRVAVPPPLFLQVGDPRRLGLIVGDGIWLRLVDLPAALAARSYEGRGTVTFEVSDAFRPANAGRWTLDVIDGRGTLSAAEPGIEADIALDIADLAAVYLGAFRFADLAAAGRLVDSRAEAVRDVDRLFRTAVAPWCSTMF